MTTPIIPIYLLDLVVYITGTGIVTLHYGMQGYTLNGVYYEPRLKQPGNIKQSMFQDGRTGGESQVGYGEIILNNDDGGLDALIDYGFDGRAITLTLVNEYGNAPILIGSMEQPTFSFTEIAIRLKDKQAELNVPLQSTKYLGNNSLPNGLEGIVDIQGKPKPLAYGQCKNISPVCVNTSKLTYQVNDGMVYDIPAVYDMGVSLTKGADYANSTLLQAATPTGGTYITCFAEGYFRLGSSPVGEVTADVTQGATAALRTAAQIAKQIALRKLTSTDLVEQGFIDLDAANSAEVALYVKDETTINAVLDLVCQSVGAWYGFNNLGKFDICRMEIPSGNPIMTLDDSNILTIERIPVTDPGRGVPAYRVILEYDKNNTVQASGLAGQLYGDGTAHSNVTDTRLVWLNNEFRKVKSEDTSVLTKHLLATEITFPSLLISESDTQTECDRLLALYKTRHDLLQVKIKDYFLQYDNGGWWDDKSISDIAISRYYHSSNIFGNFVYLLGGRIGIYPTYSSTASVIRLDLTNPTGSWDDAGVTDLPAIRYDHSSNIFGNFVYVLGGVVSSSSSTSTIRLDLTNPTGSWDDAGITNLSSARYGHTSEVFGNFVYVLGGNFGSSPTASVIRLDLTNPTGSWDDAGVTDLPTGRAWHSSNIFGNFVYVFGGFGGSYDLDEVIRLDLTNPTGSWETVTSLPWITSGHSSEILGNFVYVILGGNTLIRLDLSNPTGPWQDMETTFPDNRAFMSSFTYNGNMYTTGGLVSILIKANTFVYRSNENAYDRARLTDFGNTVNLSLKNSNVPGTYRFGYGSSKLMRVIGVEKDFALNDIIFTLWG